MRFINWWKTIIFFMSIIQKEKISLHFLTKKITLQF